MFSVVVHPQAKEDILRNAIWWADKHSLDQAIAWVDAVEHQLQDLSGNPNRFSVADENELFAYEIRQMPVGLGSRRSYRAIYSIDGNDVHVLTVRRAEQDRIHGSELPDEL